MFLSSNHLIVRRRVNASQSIQLVKKRVPNRSVKKYIEHRRQRRNTELLATQSNANINLTRTYRIADVPDFDISALDILNPLRKLLISDETLSNSVTEALLDRFIPYFEDEHYAELTRTANRIATTSFQFYNPFCKVLLHFIDTSSVQISSGIFSWSFIIQYLSQVDTSCEIQSK